MLSTFLATYNFTGRLQKWERKTSSAKLSILGWIETTLSFYEIIFQPHRRDMYACLAHKGDDNFSEIH